MTLIQRIRKINLISDILTPFAVIMMETLWLYPWSVFVGEWTNLTEQRPPLSLISLILLLGVSFIVTKFFLSRKWSMPWIQASIIIFAVVAIFLTIRIEYGTGFKLLSGEWFGSYAQIILDSFSRLHPIVFAIPIGLYMWWRGIRLGRSPLHFDNIYRTFLIELTGLVLLIILWYTTTGLNSLQTTTNTIGSYIAGFFFFGLLAMALANLQTIRGKIAGRESINQIFSRRWLFIILGVIAGIILGGIGISSIFSPQIILFLGQVIKFVTEWLGKIAFYIFIPIGYLLEWIVWLGRLIISWLSGGKTPPPTETPEFANPGNIEKGTGIFSPQVVMILKWVFLALVLIAVFYLIFRTIRRLRASKEQDEVEEEHESLWSWIVFKSDLRLFLDMLLGRFRRKKKPLTENPAVDFTEPDNVNARLSIREIYRYLLHRTAHLGLSREKYETPYEYARRVQKVIPGAKEPLTELTTLYVSTRYGEQEEDKSIEDANILWRMLRVILTE